MQLSNDGYTVYTIDHDDGKLRLDLEHLWGSASPPQPVELSEEMLCDPEVGCRPANTTRFSAMAMPSRCFWSVVGSSLVP